MNAWQENFTDKLRQVQTRWLKQFEDVLNNQVEPAFDDISGFLRNHNFNTGVPMREEGRRSFKFELAENAYLLLIFRSSGIGEFELRRESFVPGREPTLRKNVERLADVKSDWAQREFQDTLDEFITLLNGEQAAKAPEEELVEMV